MADRRWRSFRSAAWLGWQIESNWTQPALFALYSIVRPLSLAGILVVIYATVRRGDFDSPTFACMYVGNAFYLYVGAVMSGMAYAVVDDRERYQTLKSIYVAPIDVPWYLAGRGTARFVTGSASVLITLCFGVIFLGVPIDPFSVNWLLFAVALTLGVAMLAALGLLLASVILLLPHQSFSVGDAVAGSLYLFSGAIFPLEVLPAVLRPIGLAMPVTYWLELLRRSLLGPISGAFPTLSHVTTLQLLALLTTLTAGLWVLAGVTFRHCDQLARERGLLDRTTGY